MKISRAVLLVSLGLVFSSAAWAEIKLSNPGFARKESLSYTESLGSVSRPWDVTLTLVGEGSQARYEQRSRGAELESLYRLDPSTLISVSSETTTKAVDADVRRTGEFRNLHPKTGALDLVVTDLGSLPVVLRGFPWGQVSSANILYVGNTTTGSSAFGFELKVLGKETLTAAGRSWSCWHVTTGLSGAMSVFLAKTDWWFAVDGTHLLVKTSGPSGGPGSPTRTLVLQSYQVEN